MSYLVWVHKKLYRQKEGLFRLVWLMGGLLLIPALAIGQSPVKDLGGALIIDLNGTGTGTDQNLTFKRGGAALPLTPAATLTDGDDPLLTSMTLTLRDPFDGAHEHLSSDVSGTVIAAEYTTATGQLRLTGTDTLTNYESVLRKITYVDTAETPDIRSRTVEVAAINNQGFRSTATAKISIDALCYFVDGNRPDDYGDGLSWATAKKTIEAGINAAHLGVSSYNNGRSEVWIKGGVYAYQDSIHISSVWYLEKNIKLKGGFSGTGSIRDTNLYETLLDGRCKSDAVVSLASSSSIDGCTIVGGYLYGIYCYSLDAATIKNCRLHDNNTGIYTMYTVVDIHDCVVTDNGQAPNFTGVGDGGGITLFACNGVVRNCLISRNRAREGGGFYITNPSAPTVENCIVTSNTSTQYGGGGFYVYGTTATIRNCIISHNRVTTPSNHLYSQGGGLVFWNNNSKLSNCTIIDNNINNHQGDGIAYCGNLANYAPVITNCILWGNGIDVYRCQATYSCIQSTDSESTNLHVNPLLMEDTNGRQWLRPGSPCIDTGRNASAPSWGGVTTDADGIMRGVDGIGDGPTGPPAPGDGSDFDIGADEYADGPWGIMLLTEPVDGKLDFNLQYIPAGPSAPRAVTIRNTGHGPLHFTGAGFNLAGDNTDEFRLTATPDITPLAPGASRTVQVVFDPANEGDRAARLVINTDNPFQAEINVPLTGIGGYVPGNAVWVDFNWLGQELGTQAKPFNTLGEAVTNILPGGLVHIKTGATGETPRLIKQMRLEAVNGPVRLGQASVKMTASQKNNATKIVPVELAEFDIE